jgi:hypothetical protein
MGGGRGSFLRGNLARAFSQKKKNGHLPISHRSKKRDGKGSAAEPLSSTNSRKPKREKKTLGMCGAGSETQIKFGRDLFLK